MLWWTMQNLAILALLTAVVWTLCRVRRIGPVGRHALWLVVLLKMLTPPLLVWPWGVGDPFAGISRRSPLSPIQTPPATPPAVLPNETVATDTLPNIEIPPAPIAGPVNSPPSPQPPAARSSATVAGAAGGVSSPADRSWSEVLLPALGGIWLAGGICFAALQCARIARMRLLLRRATPAGPALAHRIGEVSARLGLRPVTTRVVPGIASPMLWCLHRPELLWPAALPAELSDESVRGLIVHELAHLKRRDHWVGWLELIAGCLWWWNPLYWYARHQLRENAELACDGWVVQAIPGGRRAYAEALLSVCACMSEPRVVRPKLIAPMPVVGVSTGGRRFIERRLSMILREKVAVRLPRLGLLTVALLALVALPAWSQKQVTRAESGEELGGEAGGYAGASARLIRRAPVAPLPDEAQKLVQASEARREAARAELEKKLAEERETLIKGLRELQDSYTRAAKLDEAVAIRDYIRRLEASAPAGGAAAPVNLMDYRDRVGRRFRFEVTGSTEGNVWGGSGNVYTDDSTLAAAAVHAGILAPGQRGEVEVTVLPGQSSYDGSTRNGVTSSPYGAWSGSYQLAAPLHSYGPVSVTWVNHLPDPGTLSEYRNLVGQVLTFEVVGAADGTIWGTDAYTDDSPLATAAVHAGVVGVGQRALVRVTILPGQDRYEGSTRNGVTSQSWPQWGGSYRVEAAGNK